MSNNWLTLAEAVTMISKHNHHQVSSHHVRTLVNRGKIGMRSLGGNGSTGAERCRVNPCGKRYTQSPTQERNSNR